MAVIQTQRNMVCAYEPVEEDSFVLTLLRGSEQRHLLSTQHIDQYREAVDWAVGIADQMALPLEVVPITAGEWLERNRDGVERALAGLSGPELGALRQQVVTTCAEVMRDCPEPELRGDAFDVLLKMGVFERC